MTREEAIYWIENLSGSWDGQYREARDMAISALREQEDHFREVTKMVGCDWCKSLNKPFGEFGLGDMLAIGHVEYTFIGDGRMYQQKVRFCPLCGKNLEEQE